jgi:hypothetical protein
MMGKKVDQAANWVNEEVIQPVGNFVGETVEAIADDPLPFIATIALSTVMPTYLASAVVTAARGGDMEDIVIAAGSAYVGQEVGKAAGAGASGAGASAALTNIAASAAGASAATVTASLAYGKSFEESLEAGLTAGALSGATQGVIEVGQYALAPPETGQGIKVVPGKSSQLSKDSGFGEPGITEPSLLGDQTSVSGTGFTEKVPTGGGQGLTVNTSAILPASLRRYDTDRARVRGTEEGGLQPAYTSAADILTPPSFDKTLAPDIGYKEPRTVTDIIEKPISPITEAIAKPIISGALSELFGLGPKAPGPKAPGARSAGDSSVVAQTATTGTTVGLTGAGGAGEIESKESGKKRSNVWNEESLRLKDALGV